MTLMRPCKFAIGDEVKNKITGLRGIIAAVTYHATGCIHYGVQPKFSKDGKDAEWQHYEEGNLTLIKAGAIDYPAMRGAEAVRSGPFPNPPKQ